MKGDEMTVTDDMIRKAVNAHGSSHGPNEWEWMRDALLAALSTPAAKRGEIEDAERIVARIDDRMQGKICCVIDASEWIILSRAICSAIRQQPATEAAQDDSYGTNPTWPGKGGGDD